MADFLYANPRAMHALAYAEGERLDEATRKRVESSLGTEQRLAKALVELESKGVGRPEERGLVLRFSQQELTDLIGASRESVVAAVKAFRLSGLVSTGRVT